MLIKLTQDFQERLTETEHNVIAFLNGNMEKITAMSISDVADATYSSPATVSRAVKKCGISGFAELRYLLAQQANVKQDNLEVNEIFNKSLLEVSNTIDHLNIDTILSIVKEIHQAKRIYLLSRGLTEHVAQEFALKLQILGYNILPNSDPSIMQEITQRIHARELVIIFSLSGKTKELVHAAENAVSLGARIICITCGTPETALARMANIAIFGYKHSHVAIKTVDATSRLPLYVISRIIIDYLVMQHQQEKEKAAQKRATQKRWRRF